MSVLDFHLHFFYNMEYFFGGLARVGSSRLYMSSASEVPSDTGHIESAPAGTKTEFLFSGRRILDKEGEIRPLDGREHFVDELRSELALGNAVSFEEVVGDDSPDNSPSFEGNKVFQHMSVQLEIMEFLAFVGVEYYFVILCLECYELARHFKGMRTDTVLETIGVADDSEQKESGDLGRNLSASSPRPFSALTPDPSPRGRGEIYTAPLIKGGRGDFIGSGMICPGFIATAQNDGVPPSF